MCYVNQRWISIWYCHQIFQMRFNLAIPHASGQLVRWFQLSTGENVIICECIYICVTVWFVSVHAAPPPQCREWAPLNCCCRVIFYTRQRKAVEGGNELFSHVPSLISPQPRFCTQYLPCFAPLFFQLAFSFIVLLLASLSSTCKIILCAPAVYMPSEEQLVLTSFPCLLFVSFVSSLLKPLF